MARVDNLSTVDFVAVTEHSVFFYPDCEIKDGCVLAPSPGGSAIVLYPLSALRPIYAEDGRRRLAMVAPETEFTEQAIFSEARANLAFRDVVKAADPTNEWIKMVAIGALILFLFMTYQAANGGRSDIADVRAELAKVAAVNDQIRTVITQPLTVKEK